LDGVHKREEYAMWIETAEVGTDARVELLCDECGAMFKGERREDRQTYWRLANIAGWIRVARAPERHVCANC
jgi:hypothetical protein